MAVERKHRIKRAVLSWLCAAAIFSGNLPGTIRVISTSVTAAAEDPVSYDAVIDLSQMGDQDYRDRLLSYGVDTEFHPSMSEYLIKFNQEGTYKLIGENKTGTEYYQTGLYNYNTEMVSIVCENAYIRNEDSDNIFSGNMVVSGTLIVDDVSGGSDFSVTGGNVSANFRKVEYKNTEGNIIGKSYYLSGTTYSDKLGITSDKNCIYTEDEAGNKTAVPTTITADTTVIC
ncbi:MAG: hypothetical protein ACI4Q4_06245, partial [Oscillospiraceae bacterium]